MAFLVSATFLLLVLFAPWPIGGNFPFARTCFLGLAFVALTLALVELVRSRYTIRLSLVWLLLFGLTAFSLIQMAPLDSSIGLAQVDGQESRSSTISVYPSATRSKLVDLTLAIGVFFASTILLYKRKRITIVLGALAIVGVALSLFGVAQNLTWNGKLFWSYELLSGGRPFGSFVNKNNAAGFLLISLSAAIFFVAYQLFYRLENQRQRKLIYRYDWESESLKGRGTMMARLTEALADMQPKHLYFGAALVIIAAGIFVSLSRGGMIALILASTVGVFLIAPANRLIVFLIMAILIGSGIGLIVYTDQVPAITQQIESLVQLDEAAESRFAHWSDAWPYAVEHWLLGSGNGTYRYVSPGFETNAFHRTFAHAENVYLETLVETGAVGVLILVGVIVLLTIGSIQLYLREQAFDRALGATALICLVGQVVAAIFDFGIYQPANFIALAALMGAVVARAGMTDTETVQLDRAADHPQQSALTRKPLAWIPLVLLVGAIGGTAWAGYESVGIESERLASRSIAYIKQQHGATENAPIQSLDQIEDLLELAINIRPDDSEAHFQLGELHLLKYRDAATEGVANLLVAVQPDSDPDDSQTAQPDAETIWNLTSISLLHREYRLAERNDPGLATTIKQAPLVQDFLFHAWREFEMAESLCPYLSKTQLRLAQLSAFFENDGEAVRLQAALNRSPANSQMLFDCGLLALNSGNQPLAIKLWNQCLLNPVAHIYERPIIELCQEELPMQAMFEHVLPQQPGILIDVARKYFHEPHLSLPKKLLLVHTKRVIAEADLDETEREFYFAETERMAQQFQLAANHYRKALELEPAEVVWRFEYAKCLHQLGDYDEAIRQLKICELEPSKIQANIKPTLDRIRRDRSLKQKASSTN